MPAFRMTYRAEEAAKLAAEDRLSDEEIAKQVGICVRTLYNWRKQPEFQRRVDELIAEFAARVERYAIAQKGRRVAALHDRWRRMQQVIEERAADPQMQGIPGGQSGLLVHQVKGIGRGDDFQVVDEYKVDDGLLSELRAHEQQAAKELGQWAERHDVDLHDERTADDFDARLADLAARICGVAAEPAEGDEGRIPGGPDAPG